MGFSFWRNPRKKNRLSRSGPQIVLSAHSGPARLRLEVFEERVLLDCTFLPHPYYTNDPFADVCTTADAGPHSLRDAINYVNSLPPPPPGFGYEIAFDIQALGVQTIHPRSQLPPLNNTTIIDGTTQCYSGSSRCSPYVDRPVIELDGSGAGPNANGLVANAQSVIDGLAINNFSSSGILVQQHQQSILVQNYIGTDPAGTAVRSNRVGVTIRQLANNTCVGGSLSIQGACAFGPPFLGTDWGNLISGNTDAGVVIEGNVTGNHLLANKIGTDFRGLNSVANSNGIVFASGTSFNTIGGSLPSDANLISGNRLDGILIKDRDTSDNKIVGNKIGTNITGTADLGLFNNVNGIDIVGEPIRTFPTNTLIDSNQVSGNLGAGVQLSHSTQGNVIVNNKIGTNAAGTSALANRQTGIVLLDVDHNTVGGTTASARNIISGNTNQGILIGSGGNHNSILGNYIGLNLAGTMPVANGIGIMLQAGTDNTIGGATAAARNVISGNRISGITLTSNQTMNNQILGNFIGLNAAGTAAVGNNTGIMLSDSAANNSIGGSAAGAGNVISGNMTSGILIADSATGTQVQGNLIGTNPAGTSAIPNRTSGIAVVRSSGSLIGGTTSGARNIISGNTNQGILLSGGGDSNSILGNYIGVNSAGTASVANGTGIILQTVTNTTIGGADFGARNVISGNADSGILIADGATGTQVRGNLIGTNSSGTDAIPNQSNGIAVVHASGNFIGGPKANRIAFNGNDGILVDTGTANTILENYIYNNNNLGIELINGGNLMLQFPAIQTAVTDTVNQMITMTGTYVGAPNTDYTLEFFVNSACDPSGFGQGQITIGPTVITTDPSGTADFSATIQYAVDPDQFITATATDGLGNTSQFSACTQVTDGGPSGGPGGGGTGQIIGIGLANYPQQTAPSLRQTQGGNPEVQYPSLSEQDLDLFFTSVQESSAPAPVTTGSGRPDLSSFMNRNEVTFSQADSSQFQLS